MTRWLDHLGLLALLQRSWQHSNRHQGMENHLQVGQHFIVTLEYKRSKVLYEIKTNLFQKNNKYLWNTDQENFLNFKLINLKQTSFYN